MEDSNRIENHRSPANHIPESRRIIQADVLEAQHAISDFHRKVMESGAYPMGGYPGNASRVMDRAYKHQPGEKGSSTFRKGDIVR